MTRWIRIASSLCLAVGISTAAEEVDPTLEQLLEEGEQAPVVEPVSEPQPASAQDGMREVKFLVQAGEFERARRVVKAHLEFNPSDLSAKQLLLRIDIAEREQEIRGLIAQQADMHEEVLGHPAYEAEKAITVGIERQRLDMIEYLVTLQRYEDALQMVNGMLEDNPDQMAALQIKSRLLEKIHRRERQRVERERTLRNMDMITDVVRAGMTPQEPDAIPRTVLLFDEDLADQERSALLAKLREPVEFMQFEEASLSAVLNQLFMIADINYIISDQALGEETLTINVQESTVESVLTTIQRMLPVRFNYHAGSVYVTDNENPVLVTDIYRLKSGLTDVMRKVDVSNTTSGSSGGNLGGGRGGGQAAAAAAAASAAGGGNEEDTSDIERLMLAIEGGSLTDWPAGSKLYLERKSNTLYIRSAPSVVAEVKRLLQAIDYNSVQVLVETKFVEVSDDAQKQLGVDWAVAGNKQQSSGETHYGASSGTPMGVPIGDSISERTLSFTNALASGGGLNIGAVGFGDSMLNFSAKISALEDKGEANTLSEPKVLTLSNGTGVISITREVPFISTYENLAVGNTYYTDSGSGGSTGSDELAVPVFETAIEGFRLVVTPSVARNSDIITLYLVPRITEVELRQEQFAVSVAGSAQPFTIENPIVRERTLQTTLHIRDGQTIVLGGLIAESSSEGRSGVPGLSDVPGLGRLFRTDTKDSRRSKLLIFVSGHIIDPSGAKYSDEVRHLRDTASVVLPAEVQAKARAANNEANEELLERQRAEADARAAMGDDAASGVITRPGKGPRSR